MSITVTPDGNLRFVWDDNLAELVEAGESRICRASHVEPTVDSKWTADMAPVGGPVLGPFRIRNDALVAERFWLEDHGY